MDLTPRKSIFRDTPKSKTLRLSTRSSTPKKVKFNSITCSSPSKLSTTVDEPLATPLVSSSSEIDQSSGEEWIVTKARNTCDETALPKTHSSVKNEIVSPIKLLRNPEYEVNKLPSSKKNSEFAVSPIVLKRKTDSKRVSNNCMPSQPLSPSNKLNTINTFDNGDQRISPCIVLLEDYSAKNVMDIENEKTPHTVSSTVKTGKERSEESDLNFFEGEISKLKISESPLKLSEPKATSEDDLSLSTRLKSAPKPNKNEETSDEDSIPVLPPLKNNSSRKSVNNETHRKENKMDFDLPSVRKSKRTPSKKKVNSSDDERENFVSPPKRAAPAPVVAASPVTPRRSNRKSTSQYKPSSPLTTPRTRSRKSVNYKLPSSESDERGTPNKRISSGTPKKKKQEEDDTPNDFTPPIIRSSRRSVAKPRESVVDSPDLRRQLLTPKASAKKKLDLSSLISTKKVGSGFLSPVIHERARRSIFGPSDSLAETRASLHTSNVPTSLPCREKEFENILKFISRKIEDKAGGCMYISGVPGTGKTATVHAVVRTLQEKATSGDVPKFDFVEINALRLTEPRQAYSRLWKELSGDKLSPDSAMKALEKKFNQNTLKRLRPCVVLVDELDYLCNRRQDVIYNILEWSTKSTAALTLLTIANTMDMPERTLKGKVTSRMGLTRLVFQPYTFQQLQQIVMNRIGEKSNFHADAVQLIARKVAAVSGDARRALDICRRLTESVTSDTDIIQISHVERAMTQIFAGTRVQAIKKSSLTCQFILRAMRDEYQRTGVEESTVGQIYTQFCSICAFEGCEAPPVGVIATLCTVLAQSGLILAEKSRADLFRKISLNTSADDIFYACNC